MIHFRALILIGGLISVLESLEHREKRSNNEQEIINLLLKNYDMRVRPPPMNKTIPIGPGYDPNQNLTSPVVVTVNIMIRMLSKIDVVNMEYSMQITFRESWYDPRMAYEKLGYPNTPKFLTVPHIKNNIWIPDTFFPTEKAAHLHEIDTSNMFLRIYPDGKILYSNRISLTNSCPMQLQLYPLDLQRCSFDIISYAHTMKDIIYEWEPTGPVQLKTGVGSDLPNFVLTNISTNNDCTSHTNTGSYACLRMQLMLKRQFSYYLVQLYGPTTMIVIVSWVSFWIDMHSTAGRVALGVTTLLTMTTMQSSINAKLPPVSYIKVVDVWLGACQMFVFGALIEYAFVSYQDNNRQSEKQKELAQAKQRKKRQKMEMVDAEIYQPPCTCHLYRYSEPTWKERIKRYFTKPDYLPARIDFYCRFYVPLAFLVFNIVYWSSCLIMSAKAAAEIS